MSDRAAWLLFFAVIYAGAMYAWAQPGAPDAGQIVGCVFTTTTPTYSDGQRGPLLCDVHGNLKVKTQ